MMHTFNGNLSTLKRISPPKDEGYKPTVVDLTELVDGLREHKLRHWFQGKTVEALKIRLIVKKKSVHLPKYRIIGDGEEVSFGKKDFSVCFAEPGEKELNALNIPGFEGQHPLIKTLGEFGIEVDPNADLAKLPKRLKRALLVATYAASSDISVRVNADDADRALPEKFIDGCFLINLKTAQKIVRDCGRKEKLRAYDTIQASLAWEEGLAKGTAVLIPDLNEDCIVQECNIKREVRFKGRPLLSIEGFQHARTPCTDLQTIGNLMAMTPMMRVAQYHLDKLAAIADDPDATDAWFAEEFEHHDWYSQAVRAHVKDGKPMPEYKPTLSIAREAGIKKISQTPVLKEVTYKHACKTLDIRALKARFPHGEAVAGYLIPDVSRIDRDGLLRDSQHALRYLQIRAPRDGKHSVPVGDAVVTRNPNAWGEALTCNVVDTGKYRSRTAVQLSLEGAEMSDALATWGGADMDDSLCIWSSPDMLEAYENSEVEREEAEVPRVDLEQYIDNAVQNASGYSLDLIGQMALASRPLSMHLGQIVNFFMNLRLCRQYDWYKQAAACTTTVDEAGTTVSAVDNLSKVYDMYNTTHPYWADIFCPVESVVEEDGIDPKARVPRQNGEYIAHVPTMTDMGDVVRAMSDNIYNMLECERTTPILHEGARITTREGGNWLVSQSKHGAAAVRAVILEWGWKALTARNPIVPLQDCHMEDFIGQKQQPQIHNVISYKDTFGESITAPNLAEYNRKVIEKWQNEPKADWAMDLGLREDRTKEGRILKQKEWGKLAGRVLTGNEEWDRQIVAHLGALLVNYSKRWDNEAGGFIWKYGVDSLMWNQSSTVEGVVMERGVPEIWSSLMKEFEERVATDGSGDGSS